MNCTSRTNWAYYLSSDDVLQYKNAGSLVADFPLSYEPDNTAQQVIRPGKNAGDAERTFSLVTLGRDKDKLKKGDRVWVVSDGDSLTPVAPAASSSEPVFNGVYVPPTPVPVSAGDSLGHLGFYQLPEENGKRSRYQVHIECLSMDDMEKFITNPGRVGEDTPVYLTWQADAPLFEKGEQGMVAGSRKTKISGIVTLAKVPGVDAAGTALSDNKDAAYFQIRQEGGWLPTASVQKVSQYALGELGFATLDKAPASFDLIDGINQPNNVVKGILEQLYKAAQEETRTTHALNKYNYKRLLELIDRNQDGYYSEQEYLQAIHNVSYRDHLYRVIAKHASEWYYGKDDQLWKTYLDTLTTDAPLWKTYRDEPGVATGEGKTLSGSEKWLEAASSGLGAPVPSQIADKLRGQEFSNFDAFRTAFWKAVADDSALLSQFTRGNQALIKKGYAPFTIPEEQVGGRKTFEIHHNERIVDGGEVFDMDNLSVATPRRHIDIHRGKSE